jgi:hypothetical protein
VAWSVAACGSGSYVMGGGGYVSWSGNVDQQDAGRIQMLDTYPSSLTSSTSGTRTGITTFDTVLPPRLAPGSTLGSSWAAVISGGKDATHGNPSLTAYAICSGTASAQVASPQSAPPPPVLAPPPPPSAPSASPPPSVSPAPASSPPPAGTSSTPTALPPPPPPPPPPPDQGDNSQASGAAAGGFG